MAVDHGLVEWVREVLEPIGSVTMRPMMGGATLYLDGTVFALVAQDELWLKADAQSDYLWDEAGCDRFTYDVAGTAKSMNYRRAPSEVHDDPDTMRKWAALAVAAGQRAPIKRKRR
ncbi:TfoX/Sxy family protein [Sphingomonas xinjiangensis]|uniref:DNA transformation protein n=1 Tax=Sphingomonas xinjiangensis TaxID=643568 RepID=A0A840YG02_9SPHN|nr:TfoX/Sxy family protein [Sphingomonas xinjiangensis]MBB5711754.1 DNA transformation protein [Sphingomonas xinjiangensis]